MPLKDNKGKMELCVKVFTNALKRIGDYLKRQIPPPSDEHPGTRSGKCSPWPNPAMKLRRWSDLTFSFGSWSTQTFGPRTVPSEEILNEAACPRVSGGLGPGEDGLHVVLKTSLALLV